MLNNPKHERFCQEYIIDLNATQAAKRTGYSINTAYSQGNRLLKNVEIKKRIQELKEERVKRTKINADRVLKEIALIAFSDLRDIFEFDNKGMIRIKKLNEIPEDATRGIKQIKENRIIKESADGSQKTVHDKVVYVLYDKIKALEMLGRHLGLLTGKAPLDEDDVIVFNYGNIEKKDDKIVQET